MYEKKIVHNYLFGSVKENQFCLIKEQDFSPKRNRTTVKTSRSGFECKCNGQIQIGQILSGNVSLNYSNWLIVLR